MIKKSKKEMRKAIKVSHKAVGYDPHQELKNWLKIGVIFIIFMVGLYRFG